VQVSRKNPNEFCEYVVRNELPAAKGRKITQARVHEEMQRLFTNHPLIIMWSHVESGKTAQAIGRVLWELGHEPNLRVAICSGAEKQARKITKAVKEHIERSPELHEVFPNLVPQDKGSWGVNELTVKRPIIAKDPTIQIATVGSGSITGSRLDLVVLDDILTPENTRTQEARDKIAEWLDANIISRLTDSSRVWLLGNAQHPDDMMHRLASNPSWVAQTFPVLREDGTSNWPEQWPLARINERRKTLQHRPEEFERSMMCRAAAGTSGSFKRAWIDICLKRGAGKAQYFNQYDRVTPEQRRFSMPPGFSTICGVDIGGLAQTVARRRKSDKTVFFTIARHPNGHREVLDIRGSNQWVGIDLIRMMQNIHMMYGCIFFVESNQAQKLVVDFTRDLSAVPVQYFNTGGNKMDPDFGVTSIGVEMAGGQWIIPSNDAGQAANPEIAKWIMDMLDYRPGFHTGDFLMASWIAREGARAGLRKAQKKTIDLQTR